MSREDMDWLAEAACRGADTNLFYPTDVGRHVDRKAKQNCEGCPVIAECLDWALRHGEHGIWGGTTDNERKRLRRNIGVRVQRITYVIHGTEAAAAAHRRAGEVPCRSCATAANLARRERLVAQ
jgi:WhiB family redox-sensing transcriptional regulator